MINCVLQIHVIKATRFAEFSSNSSGIEEGREVEPAQLAAPTQVRNPTIQYM